MMLPWPRTWRAGSGGESRAIVHALYHAAGGAPMIDLGARSAPLTRTLEGTWVEVDPQHDSPSGTLSMDLLEAARTLSGFKLVVLTDVIEHLPLAAGKWLLSEGIRQLGTACVVFTPVGDYCVSDATSPHAHRSGWHPETFWRNEWAVWEWPAFHRFDDGTIHGAFFAWHGWGANPLPTAAELATVAGVPL